MPEETAMELFKLTGRVAIVTGGNRGIGYGMARGLARAGAHVLLAARNTEKSSAAAAELQSLGGIADILDADMRDEASCRSMIRKAEVIAGRVDILVNNAGINIRKRPEEYTANEWREILSTNLDGCFWCAQAAHPIMKANGGGKIINVASILASLATPFGVPYAASKGALIQMTKGLAIAWAADNIQVNAVLPGWTDTDAAVVARRQVPTLDQAVLSRTPAKRWGRIDDYEGPAVSNLKRNTVR
jgi:2-dehydro-3-deoxy-D-gluconate 5-dehydrogenase